MKDNNIVLFALLILIGLIVGFFLCTLVNYLRISFLYCFDRILLICLIRSLKSCCVMARRDVFISLDYESIEKAPFYDLQFQVSILCSIKRSFILV